jgi:exopolyphosphatase / guanosine-5'-triphosphate,3'-diphosphate pyrophosphatase
VGVLDLGTNTLSMTAFLGDPREPRRLSIAEELQFVTGLGRQRLADGSLSEAGMARAWSALRYVSGRLASLGVPRVGIRGAATAACREAPNGPAFLCRVEEELGLPLRVVAGPEEAHLVAIAQAHSFRDALPIVAVDIGGGSTEVAVVETTGAPSWARSIPYGATKLGDRLGPRATEEAARAEIAQVLDGIEFPRGYSTVGVAGTVTAAIQVLDDSAIWDPATQHGRRLDRAQVLSVARRLLGMSPDERRCLASLHPGRADYLGPALIWLDELMSRLGVDVITTSDRGVRFGLLWSCWPGVMVV